MRRPKLFLSLAALIVIVLIGYNWIIPTPAVSGWLGLPSETPIPTQASATVSATPVSQSILPPTTTPLPTRALPTWSARLQRNAEAVEKIVFLPLRFSLRFLVGVLVVTLALLVLVKLWNLYFSPPGLNFETLVNATGDASLDGLVKGLTAEARYWLISDLKAIKDKIPKHSRRLTGAQLHPDTVMEDLTQKFDENLSTLLASVKEVAPAGVKPVLQLVNSILPQRGTQVTTTIFEIPGGKPDACIPGVAVEIVSLEKRFAPIFEKFREEQPPADLRNGANVGVLPGTPALAEEWRELIEVARDLINAGEFEDALAYLQPALKKAPEDDLARQQAMQAAADGLLRLQETSAGQRALEVGDRLRAAGLIEPAVLSYLAALRPEHASTARLAWEALLTGKGGSEATGEAALLLAGLHAQVSLSARAQDLYRQSIAAGNQLAPISLRGWLAPRAAALGDAGRRLIALERRAEAKKYLQAALVMAPDDENLLAQWKQVAGAAEAAAEPTPIAARARDLVSLAVRVIALELTRAEMLNDRRKRSAAEIFGRWQRPPEGLYQPYAGNSESRARAKNSRLSKIELMIGQLYQSSLSNASNYTEKQTFFQKARTSIEHAQFLDPGNLELNFWVGDVYADALHWAMLTAEERKSYYTDALHLFNSLITDIEGKYPALKLKTQLRMAQMMLEKESRKEFDAADAILQEIQPWCADKYPIVVENDYTISYNLAKWYACAYEWLLKQQVSGCCLYFRRARFFLACYLARDDTRELWSRVEREPELLSVRSGMHELKQEIQARGAKFKEAIEVRELADRRDAFAALMRESMREAGWRLDLEDANAMAGKYW